jgi:hypothetical protein
MPTTALALAAPGTVHDTNAQAGRRDASPEVATLDLAARLGVLHQSGNEVRTDTLCGHLVFDGSARRLACGDILCAYPDCDNEHLDHCGDCRAVVLSS